jgi:hypothetical protein
MKINRIVVSGASEDVSNATLGTYYENDIKFMCAYPISLLIGPFAKAISQSELRTQDVEAQSSLIYLKYKR